MLYNAKNCNIKFDDIDMDYVSFGKGKEILVMIPGVGDGLKTVKGSAFMFARMYKCLVEDFTVYIFSRKNNLPSVYTNEQMADDMGRVFEKLSIKKANVMGVSQGGMIAQYLGLKYPHLVKSLILTVTMCRQNETVQTIVPKWIDMAKKGDYKGIMIDVAKNSYSESFLKKQLPMYSFIANFSKPKSFDRFITQAQACLVHDSFDEIKNIKCPTLIVGGTDDKIVTAKASYELAQQIDGSVLKMYEGLGHALYEETADFVPSMVDFIKNIK